jgi:hypothetical protein
VKLDDVAPAELPVRGLGRAQSLEWQSGQLSMHWLRG